MSIAVEPSQELIPGYVLTERIGSGGYAEVWRAQAPGGIDKAVKIVHGYYDDEFASQELKALERIKGVRHPFLLSLERFEIVSGRLAILTELADLSLEQRLRQCRADGLPGIPREEILRYMSDAAEALDYLLQRHGLLHLDVKPENLLISGDHLKVADFGLVKELTNRTENSLVAGLTPIYASPEMFDDTPSEQSDQYSLAIVYQEMLVGTLPFPGRTAAQLAKQHTQAEPQLMPLPADDRPVIARALAKRPEDRFPTCKDFVEALLHSSEARSGSKPAGATKLQPAKEVTQSPPPPPDDTERASLHTTQRRAPSRPDVAVTQPIDRASRRQTNEAPKSSPAALPEVDSEIVDVAVPNAPSSPGGPQPTLYVAIGGVGIQVLSRLRDHLADRESTGESFDAIETIALDTDRSELRDACSAQWRAPLDPGDMLHLPLRLPKSYDDSRDTMAWVSRRWLYNIPRSLETRGYRAIGRVALVDHAQRVLDLLEQKLDCLAAKTAPEATQEEPAPPVSVVLLAGMGGGTGGGMLIDVANAVKSLAASRGAPPELRAVLMCTFFGSTNASVLSAANSFSLLTELRHTAELGNQGLLHEQNNGHPFESKQSPFDFVYCVPVRAPSTRRNSDQPLESIAKYLALDMTNGAREAMNACRATRSPRESELSEPLCLRTFGIGALTDQKQELLWGLARSLATTLKQRWLRNDSGEVGNDKVDSGIDDRGVVDQTVDDGGDPSVQSDASAVQRIATDSRRNQFGNHAATPFAREILSHLRRRTGVQKNERNQPSLTTRDAETYVTSAVQVVNNLAANLPDESDDSAPFEGSSALADLVPPAGERVLASIIAAMDPTQPGRVSQADAVDELITAECVAFLKENWAGKDASETLAANSQLDVAMNELVTRASAELLKCGFDRRTLMFAPENRAASPATEHVGAIRPQAAIVAADVDDVLVVCEGSGISSSALAINLARVYPGIADAARRLATRVDIEWKSLF